MRGNRKYWYCVQTRASRVSATPPGMFSKPPNTSEREKMSVDATGAPLPSTGTR
jgi:hypothetical protein